jgi:methionyl-tRNA formyltransferase
MIVRAIDAFSFHPCRKWRIELNGYEMTDLCVIASPKTWNKRLPENLHILTGMKFERISNPSDLTFLRLSELRPRYVFFPHWSHRIPADVFKNFECVIFHMTDLPFGRGGSPLQNLVARGIYETRISALRCVEELDAGPIYLKRPLSLHGAAEEIYLRASDVVEQMIVEIIKAHPQPLEQEGEPTYFKRRTPAQGDLSEATSLDQAFDLIRMLDADGYPNAYINVGNFRLEFSRANRKAGCLVADVRIALRDKVSEGSK